MDIKSYLEQLILNNHEQHYQKLKGAIWLLLYLLLNCGSNTWIMVRKVKEIARQMGLKPQTVKRWLKLLQKHKYIMVKKGKTEWFIHLRGGIDLFYKPKK